MRKTLSIALSALITMGGASSALAQSQSQEELRQLAFMQREMERQRQAYEARLDRLMAANEELAERVDQITKLVTAPDQNTSVADARGAESEARYAAAALIVDGTPAEQQAADLIAQGDTRGGFALLEQAAAEGADTAAERWRRLGALAFESDVQTALRAYTEAARLSPNDPETLTRLCQLQARTANAAGARETCLAAVRVAVSDKDRLAALATLDGVYNLTGEHEASLAIRPEVERLAHAVFDAQPGIDSLSMLLNVLTLEMMADVGRSDLQAVLRRADQIAALADEEIPGVDPGARDVRLLQADMLIAASFAHLTDPARMLSAFDESIALLHQIRAENPGDVLTEYRLWDRHNGRAGIYFVLGRTPDAIADFDESERIARELFNRDPTDSAKAIVLLSTVLMSMEARFSTPEGIEQSRGRLVEVDQSLARLAREDRQNAMFEVTYALVHGLIGVLDRARQMSGVEIDHDPQVWIDEATAIMGPHLEAGRVPPDMAQLWAQVQMLLAMLSAAPPASGDDAVGVEVERRQ